MANERDKLNAQVTRGNMAQIASREYLESFYAESREALLATAIDYFRSGKHGSELLAVIGELSALDKMRHDLRMRITHGNRAHVTLEGQMHENERNRFENV